MYRVVMEDFGFAVRTGLGATINFGGLCLATLFRRANMPFEPMHLNMEVTNNCNLKCKMCRRTSQPRQSIGYMTLSSFTHVLSQFRYIANLTISGLGEPLLNKELPSMIALAKQRGVGRIIVITNGTLLNPDIAMSMIDSGLDELHISVDGATPETYARIRGANLEHVLAGIADVLECRRTSRSQMKVAIVATIFEDNQDEVDALIELAQQLDVDQIYLPIMNPDFLGLSQSKPSLAQWNVRYRLTKDVTVLYPCRHAWARPFISWDGFVMPCCLKPVPEEYNFGNVFNEPFMVLWNGREANSFRAGLASGNPHPICRTCPATKRGRVSTN